MQLDGKPGQKASYAIEVLSVLDALAAPLRTRNEKTYSEPFATRLYAKETIDLPGGETVRDYPRLKHGGAHLGEREGDVAADAGLTAFRAGVLALLGWLALAASPRSALVARHEPGRPGALLAPGLTPRDGRKSGAAKRRSPGMPC